MRNSFLGHSSQVKSSSVVSKRQKYVDLSSSQGLISYAQFFLQGSSSGTGIKREMQSLKIFEEPIVPILIDHEQEVQAYYSRIEEIASQTPQNPTYQTPYPPYPEPCQYPPANYPQSYPGMPEQNLQYNPNPYGYQNQYYGQPPAAPQYNATSYGYPNPYPPANYPQYSASATYPNPAYPPQPPPNQWSGQPPPNQWSGQGQPLAPTNTPYPNYPYQNTMPGNQNNTTTPYSWSDLGSLLPPDPLQYETNYYQDHASSTSGSYIMEETIKASKAQRNFNENLSLIQDIEIGWKI